MGWSENNTTHGSKKEKLLAPPTKSIQIVCNCHPKFSTNYTEIQRLQLQGSDMLQNLEKLYDSMELGFCTKYARTLIFTLDSS